MNELTQERSRILVSIVTSALAALQIASDMNELTPERSRIHAKHCKKCFSSSSHCNEHEGTHTGETPYTCKHCNKCFSRSSSWKKHQERHARDGSLNPKRHYQRFQQKMDIQEPVTTHGGIESDMLLSVSSSEVETLTC